MAEDPNVRQAWIRRVLGVDVGSRAGVNGTWQSARLSWQDANEMVDKQISGLQRALRETGDPELLEIAEYGLNALTGGFKTGLTAALIELGADGPNAAPAAGQKALKAIQNLKSTLAADPRVAACDSNPAGVPVTIRETLLPALDRLAAALASP